MSHLLIFNPIAPPGQCSSVRGLPVLRITGKKIAKGIPAVPSVGDTQPSCLTGAVVPIVIQKLLPPPDTIGVNSALRFEMDLIQIAAVICHLKCNRQVAKVARSDELQPHDKRPVVVQCTIETCAICSPGKFAKRLPAIQIKIEMKPWRLCGSKPSCFPKML